MEEEVPDNGQYVRSDNCRQDAMESQAVNVVQVIAYSATV
jgi:hypothetical protein